ncbi:MAG: potassium channel family protein [Candidatus Eremiobacteraeota bacterium]|nr:potassium channel family protein [Candidatus Eremiobacteraeota bacterium]
MSLERYEALTALPMLFLSLGFIVLWVIPIAVSVSTQVDRALEAANWLLWAAFAIDYATRLTLAQKRIAFVRRNLIDLAIVLLPLLAPLRIVSGVRVLRVLRTVTVLSVAARAQKASRNVVNPQNVMVAIAIVATLGIVGAGLELQFERGAATSNIRSFADATWWAMTTITTVGYGDKYPTTPEGRGIALLLMLVGVGATGLLSAGLTTFLLGGRQQQDYDDVMQRLERIEALLSKPTS